MQGPPRLERPKGERSEEKRAGMRATGPKPARLFRQDAGTRRASPFLGIKKPLFGAVFLCPAGFGVSESRSGAKQRGKDEIRSRAEA